MGNNGVSDNFLERLVNGKPIIRFLTGVVLTLIVVVIGFAWVMAVIPTWGAAPGDVTRALPGDQIVSQPQVTWDHAITIHAAPNQIYPWLAQIGDTRGAFYSYTFIENLFMLSGGSQDRYVNADRIHPEWQNPTAGQGIIFTYLAIQEVKPGQYVLSSTTPEMPFMQWTWLWYLDPVDANTTRLVVRHRALFPPGTPPNMVNAIFTAGYPMERGMMRGIRDRAEGRALPAPLEGLEAALWLAVFAVGIAAAVRFVRQPGRWHPLGVGLEAIVVLFLFTFVQPPIWARFLLLLVLIFSLWIAYQPGRVSARLRTVMQARVKV